MDNLVSLKSSLQAIQQIINLDIVPAFDDLSNNSQIFNDLISSQNAIQAELNTAISLVASIQIINGTNGIDGLNGNDGYTPIKGTDYFDGAKGLDGNPNVLYNSFSGGLCMALECSGYALNYAISDGSFIYGYLQGDSNKGFRKFDLNGKKIAQYSMDALGSNHPFSIFGNYIYAINFGWTNANRLIKFNKSDLTVSSFLDHPTVLNGNLEKSGIFVTNTDVLLWWNTKVYRVNQTTLALTELVEYVNVQYVVEHYGNRICIVDGTNGYLLNDDLTIKTTKALPSTHLIVVQAVAKRSQQMYSSAGWSFLYLVNSSRVVTSFNIGYSNGGGSLTLPNSSTRIISYECMFGIPSSCDLSVLCTTDGVLFTSFGANATMGTMGEKTRLSVSFLVGNSSFSKFVGACSAKNSLWV